MCQNKNYHNFNECKSFAKSGRKYVGVSIKLSYAHGHFAHSKFVNYELFENAIISTISFDCCKNNAF